MGQPEFDQHAENYDSILDAAIPEGLKEGSYFAEYKVALMASSLKDKRPARILDFGCGSGRSLPFLKHFFPDTELWGYDVSSRSIQAASERVPNARLTSQWSVITGKHFDAIIAANVFHHITPKQRQSTLERCRDALSKGGGLFLFEHNPYNPATRWIFEHCPFDADAEMLDLKTAIRLAKQAGFISIRYGYTLFFPKPLAFLRSIETWLRRLPLGAQYYVQMVR